MTDRRVARRGATLHKDPSPGEVESVEIALPTTGTDRELLDALMRQYAAGLTMHQCTELLGWPSRDNVNPRMQELKKLGLVRKTGETRETGLGGRADVWQHTSFCAAERIETASGRGITRTPRAVPKPVAVAEDLVPTTRGASSTRKGRVEDHESLQRRLAKNRARRAGATSSS